MRILIIGPFPNPITGVSLANKVLYDGLTKHGFIIKKIDTEFNSNINSKHGSFKLNKVYIFKSYFQAYKVISSNLVYITIGQSFFGVLKYLPFLIISKVFKKKTIVHLHGGHLYNEYYLLSRIKKIIFRKTIGMFDFGIVLSESLKINLEKFLKPQNVFCLNNFYLDELKTNFETIRSKDFSKIKMVFLSNLIKEKGINNLLEAKKKLKQKGIHFNLKVAGSVISTNNLNEYFKFDNEISYLGNVTGKRKYELLLWSNIFCLPTYYNMEGQPISIIEAMATGNMILSTKHAGIIDICSEKNALFCQKNDIDDLVEKIEFVYYNSKLIQDISYENYKYASEKFTEKSFIDNAIKIFQKCMN
ncbi:glycosyltransferase involved in cell wall biosynthesis [Flavobacterium croceum DSM 17960]|uniref:Glycosyltransferase involved in cell wall biosynthesis n=1 Tax=Flavobacterium croceum DSM 17960 TaxID=1121886 RepID=A0A2S4NBI2_9FLAO|nr:glycosyltransferase [Flavobacterium croceum]POS02980.1 glycosyltransferase involved in cell wall biosynthesis [Flavobacterium croceum DSM 17960]